MNATRLPPDDLQEWLNRTLSDYAVESRYPGLTEPVTQEEYEEAVAIAEEVVLWVEGLVRGESG